MLNKAKLKQFCKEYIFAPKLLSLLQYIYGRITRQSSHINKQHHQYPYSWNGENFNHARGGNFLQDSIKSKLILVTRNLESKAAFLANKSVELNLENLPEKTKNVFFSVTTENIYDLSKDLKISIGDKLVQKINGKLISEGWQHIKINIPEGSSNLKISFLWTGGKIFISDPIVTKIKEKTSDISLQKKPNIIVIVLDSLMAETVGCLSELSKDQSYTPYIDQYFKNGHLFKNAYSISEYTMPSLATMSTGLYPIEHGVFTHDKNQRELPIEVPTLAETLRESGYRTFSYSAGGRFSPLYGHYRGYDRFFLHRQSAFNTADLQINKTIEFLKTHEDEPNFCFIHLIDPHPPFSLPTYFSDLKAGDNRWGDIGYLYSAFKLHRDSSHLIENLRSVEKIMILNVDFILSKLFSWLEYTRKKENTNILLLADHGREYRKNDPLLSKNLTHIPFLITGPDTKLTIRNEFTEAPLDLYPTVMRLAGLEPLEHLSGIDVLNQNLTPREICLSESLFRRVGEITLREKNWNYSLRCEFDYMKPNFNFKKIQGEWLFPRDPISGKEDKNYNYIDKEPKKCNQLREFALSHYSNRKNFFSNDLILDYSRKYKE